MTNQEIFEILSNNESQLFYAKMQNPDNEHLIEAHAAAKKALESFAKATGCCNE